MTSIILPWYDCHRVYNPATVPLTLLHKVFSLVLLVPEEQMKRSTHLHCWVYHSCQPVLGINLSPVFVNLYFPYAGQVFCFFAGNSSILNSIRHVWQWEEEAMLCKIHMHDFKSHFQQEFLAYCTRPVSVHLAMACVGCSFDSFSVFLLSLKHQQNLMKIMFSCIHFPVWPYPPKIMKKLYFILVNCMGWQVCYMCLPFSLFQVSVLFSHNLSVSFLWNRIGTVLQQLVGAK